MLSLLLLGSARAECSASSPCRMPNIDYIGMGYDIARGNPHCGTQCLSSGIDPGWAQTNPVLAFIYDNTTTADGRFYVPKGFRVLPSPACTMSSNTLSVHSTQSYLSALSVDAQVSGGAAAWSFSASADYQATKQSLSTYSKTQYQTTATCAVYTANVLADYTLNLTDEFRRGVSELPAQYDHDKYAAFVANYGSHFLNHVSMGAKYTYQMEFDSSDVSNMSSLGVDIAAAVSVSMILSHATVSTNVSWHQSDHQEMKKFHSTETQLSVGNLPPQPFGCTADPCSPDQMDMSSWQALLLTDGADLAPLNYQLQSLETLLTSEYFPTDADISAKAESLASYFAKDYCSDVPNCAPPNPNGYWLAQPSMPEAVMAAMGVFSGNFFVLGGVSTVGISSPSVQMFTSQDTNIGWQILPPMPYSRHNASACCDVNGAIYVFGGQTAILWNNSVAQASVQRLDVRSMKWTLQNNMPFARFSHASVLLPSGEIWVLGGNIRQNSSSQVDVYHADTDTWSRNASMNSPREGLCAGFIAGALYAVGGFDGTSFLSSLESYVDGLRMWVYRMPMTYARSGATCAVVNDQLIVAGGLNTEGVLHLVEVYQPKTDSWTRRSDSLSSIWLGSAVAMLDFPEQNLKLFVAGGASSLAEPAAGTERFHVTTGSPIYSASVLSQDNRALYVVNQDLGLFAIDTSSAVMKWIFGEDVVSVTLTQDGSRAFTVGLGVYSIDTTTGVGVLIDALEGRSVALSDDDTTLVVATAYGLSVYDVSSQKLRFNNSCGSITSAVFSADSSVVFAGCACSKLFAFSVSSGESVWSSAIPSPVTSMVLSGDNRLYVSSQSGLILAVHLDTWVVEYLYQASSDLTAISISLDKQVLYFGSAGALWAISSDGSEMWGFQLTVGKLAAPTLSHDGSRLFVGSDDENFHALDVDRNILWSFKTGDGGIYSAPLVSTDGSVVYVGAFDGVMYAVWAAGSGAPPGVTNASSSFFSEL